MRGLQELFADAVSCFRQGEFEKAELLAARLLESLPDDENVLVVAGLSSLQNGHVEHAVTHLTRVVEKRPHSAADHSNLGEALRRAGRIREAIDMLRRATAIDPNCADAWNNLGNALSDLRDFGGAIDAYRRAVGLNPSWADAWCNLAASLKDTGRIDEALTSAHSAVAASPNLARAHRQVGMLLMDQGETSGAVESLRRALMQSVSNAYHAESLRVRFALSALLARLGQVPEAVQCCRDGIAAAPESSALHSNLLFLMQFLPGVTAAQLHAEHNDWWQRHGAPLARDIRPFENDRDPDRRLRIGYVSPDFRDHVLKLYMIPLIAAHDHARFEIVCYSDVLQPDEFTSRIRARADVWRETAGKTDEQVAQLVRDDRIDVLVDLCMHMAHARPLLFARKPAPVQITWFAYPGTTGVRTIDCRLTDPVLDPPGTEIGKYTEESIRLPDTFWCIDPLSDEPVGELPALQSGGQVTFGCLNNFMKVNDGVLSLWARVLAAVPGSRMIVQAPRGRPREGVASAFAARQIAETRLTFVDYQPRSEYLRTYHRIDVALDTFPYNGHTTSLDAYWMGVPVVTLLGESIVGRAGLSQLHNLNLMELVARDETQFVQIASGLASDLNRLAELRRSLRPRMQGSPLMDTTRFARNIEASFREGWQRWCASRDERASGNLLDTSARMHV